MDAALMQQLLRRVLDGLHRSHYRVDQSLREVMFHALAEAYTAGIHKGLEIALFGGDNGTDQKQS